MLVIFRETLKKVDYYQAVPRLYQTRLCFLYVLCVNLLSGCQALFFIDLKPQIQNYSFSLYIEVISFGSSRFDTGIGAIRGKDTDRIPADKRQQH
ncbi:hypothetical protein A5877_001928 [Enterococcus sp. 3C7_DIV0644]|nr:hypothetical protein A5877_001928 [Enterococcus sp. 3C7_DIV0644]